MVLEFKVLFRAELLADRDDVVLKMAEDVRVDIELQPPVFAIGGNQTSFQIQSLRPFIRFPCPVDLLIEIAERTEIERRGIVSDPRPANVRQHTAIAPGILHALIVDLQRQVAVPERRGDIFSFFRIRLCC